MPSDGSKSGVRDGSIGWSDTMRASSALPSRRVRFGMPSGRCVDSNRLREQVLNRTLARAGLRRRTMYQTRHSFASNALAAGEPPSWVGAMLGHTTPEMLFSVHTRYMGTLSDLWAK
jgi:integrase